MEDGTRQTVRPRGDEFFNWSEASDGFAVARGANGRWQYARREKGRWVPSGMTPQQRSRVCERFYRADASGKVPGSGLGMRIVKEICDMHGGELIISSNLGVGTRVSFSVPC